MARGKATAARRPRRHSRTFQRLLHGVPLVAALILLAGFLTLAPVLPAHADEPDSLVSIQITSMTPALPAPTDPITLTGTVTNTSKKPIDKPRVYFWRNQAPITDREGFDAALDSAANDPLGARVTADVQNREHLWTEEDRTLDPGETAPFTVSATPEQLDFPAADGIYLVGVHVLTGTDQPPAIGRSRVFAPIVTDLPDQVLPTSSVVILNSRPARLQEQVFADDHLAAEVGPEGRLTRLLAAAQREGMTFAVDPSLIDELRAMRSGYQVRDEDGETTAGAGSEQATDWLRTFGELLDSRPGYRLLYGSPDVAALVRSDREALLERAKAVGAAVPETSELPLLVWPGDGAADAATIAAAGRLDPAGILLSDATTRSTAPLLRDGDGPLIINYVGASSLGGPGPDPRDSPVHQRERTLSETWLQASTEDLDRTLGQVRLITTPEEASTEQQLAAPWLRQIPLADLLRQPPERLTDEPRYPKAAQAAELDHDELRRVDDLAEAYQTYVDLLVDPAEARTDADAAVLKSVSATWRGPDSDWPKLLDLRLDQLDQVLTDAVKIGLVGRFTTTGQSDISFPITITNTLIDPAETGTANAIRVGVEFSSAQSQRLRVKPLDPVVIQANDAGNASITRNTQIEAQANGPVQVTAQLVTASGKRVGKPTTVEVTVTQAGTVGWIIAVAAGVVLIGTTVLRIRQVARERARDRDDDDTRSPPPASPVSPRRATPAASGAAGPRRGRP
ncbi:hypothetical protein [Microlunatus speluncae]|uniref:hypothetical protein n=1 Tax=Microlunatus speluncae TaxID=2594267 RepID=UPI00126611C7|nr:hypothetical protein [Microlunatus speluncae]